MSDETVTATPTPDQIDQFWTQFRNACPGVAASAQPADVFAFGDSAQMADDLVDLVLDGTKRATAGSVAEYDIAGWRPRVGDLSVVHRGDGTPAAVIRSTDVTVAPLTSVTDSFASDEGEGDRTRGDWICGHRAYFVRQALPYTDDLQVVFERFGLVWVP